MDTTQVKTEESGCLGCWMTKKNYLKGWHSAWGCDRTDPPPKDGANKWGKGGPGCGVKGKETLSVHLPDSINFPKVFFFAPKVIPRSYREHPIVIKYKY